MKEKIKSIIGYLLLGLIVSAIGYWAISSGTNSSSSSLTKEELEGKIEGLKEELKEKEEEIEELKDKIDNLNSQIEDLQDFATGPPWPTYRQLLDEIQALETESY